MCTRKFWWSAIICLSYLLAVHQSHCPLIHRLKVFLILLSKKLTASPHFLFLSSSSMKCSPVLSFCSHHCSYPLLLLLTFRFKFFKVFCLLPTYAKSFFFLNRLFSTTSKRNKARERLFALFDWKKRLSTLQKSSRLRPSPWDLCCDSTQGHSKSTSGARSQLSPSSISRPSF